MAGLIQVVSVFTISPSKTRHLMFVNNDKHITTSRTYGVASYKLASHVYNKITDYLATNTLY